MINIFPIYKPLGPTSNQILSKIKKITGIKRVGHAGTLDPLAEGVLVVGIGREATKQLDKVVQKEKEYIAEITLGATSTTDDAEGIKTITNYKLQITNNDIKEIIPEFIGEIRQVPPVYSAIKLNDYALQVHRLGI